MTAERGEIVERLRDLAAWAPDDEPDEGFALAAEAADEIERLREALAYIAAPDDLLDANEGAFNTHAARRMQAQAQMALSGRHSAGGES